MKRTSDRYSKDIIDSDKDICASWDNILSKAKILIDFNQYIYRLRNDVGKGSLYIFVDSNNKVFYIDLKDQPFTCVGCRKKHTEELRVCSKCLSNRYCDVDCQRLHWIAVHRCKCKPAEETSISDMLLTKLLIFSKHEYGSPGHDDKAWNEEWSKPTTYRKLLDSGWLKLFSCFMTQECRASNRWNISVQILGVRIQTVFMILVSSNDLDFQCCTPLDSKRISTKLPYH